MDEEEFKEAEEAAFELTERLYIRSQNPHTLVNDRDLFGAARRSIMSYHAMLVKYHALCTRQSKLIKSATLALRVRKFYLLMDFVMGFTLCGALMRLGWL